MNRFDAWLVHVSLLLVGGTGLVYAWMRYLAEPADPYAIVNHPWQPTFQHLHLWLAPLLVFSVGLIWRNHVWNHYRNSVRTGRRSGIALLLTLVPMVTSGYLIQTSVTEAWRSAWVVVHLAASGIWIAGHVAHAVAQLRRRRRRAGERAGVPAAGAAGESHEAQVHVL